MTSGGSGPRRSGRTSDRGGRSAGSRPARSPRRRPRKRGLKLGSPARRLRIGLLLIAFVVSVFAGRLLQFQGVEAPVLALRALEERLGTVELFAKRGDITDRSGVRLATTVDTVAVVADPEVTRAKAAEIADILAPALDVPVLDLEQRLSKKDRRFVYLARHVMPDVWEATKAKLKQAGVSAVWAEADPLRTYPASTLASNIVGFVGSEGHGLGGLEHSLDDQLSGRDGWARYERAKGRQIPLGKWARQDPVPGADVRLTIDRDVQWTAQRAITEQVRRTKAESGSAIVLDSRTGDLLAVATAPGFDPRKPGSAAPADRGNRPLQEVYEPGSVVKVLTAAALLDAGYVSPETKITVPGSLRIDGERISDHWDHDTIRLTFAGAIAESSNVGTVLAARKLPMEEQYAYLRKFGLGAPTGIGFPGETKGLLQPGSRWSELTRATISFGQGLSVNAVQMASALGVIANEGVRHAPVLVDGTIDEDGKVTRTARSKPTRVVSKQAAAEVTAMMEAVTGPEGVARNAAIPGYRVAGKTGTAQRFDPNCGCYNGYSASFGGFAPADDSRYVVYVVLHNPQGDHSGSGVAAPVFREIMSFVLQKYGVPPSETPAPKARLTW